MNQRRVIALVIGILGLILVIGFYYVHTNQQFRLVKSDPSNNSNPINVLSPVTFYFNRSMAATKTPADQTSIDGQNYVTSSPVTAGATTVTSDMIIFTPTQALILGTKYVLTLHKIVDINNESLPDITISFVPTYSSYTSLPPSAQQQQQARTDANENVPSSELTFRNKLPYFGNGYAVEWNQTGNFYNVTVTAAPVASTEAAALTYIQSQGIDTSQRQIVYTLSPGLDQ